MRSLLTGALGAISTATVWANEVPFATGHTISGNTDGASAVCSADVDGDGDLDVLSAADSADDITWWENTAGDGTAWTEHTIDGDFDGAASVYTADVDGDGDLDVLGAGQEADDISWWENTAGDGTAWTEHTVDGDFDGATSVYTADVDGDGDLDVLGAGQEGDDITWWENTAGDGTAWTEHTVDSDLDGAASVYAVDVDGDGDLDVLGAGQETDDILWWENTAGDGTAWTEHTVDSDFDGAASVYAVDADGDGDFDVLGAGQEADDITWWENTAGDGTAWTEHTVDGDFDGAASVYAADVDGDGDLDVLGAAQLTDDVDWWQNRTIHRNAAFPTRVDFPSNAYGRLQGITVGDFNRDGRPDFAIASEQTSIKSIIRWWWFDGSVFRLMGAFLTAKVTSGVAAADLDHDGDQDLVGFEENVMSWFENEDGDGTRWQRHSIGSHSDGNYIMVSRDAGVAVADLNNDGWLDIIGDSPGLAWWENDGGVPLSFTRRTGEAGVRLVEVPFPADLDGNGTLDIVGIVSAEVCCTYDLAWWANDGAEVPNFTRYTLREDVGVGNGQLLALDLDSDGDKDIVSNTADRFSWWESNGASPPSFEEHPLTDDAVFGVAAADLDVDGDLDLLGGRFETVWWENDGAAPPSFVKHLIPLDQGFGTNRAAVADFTGDGLPDIVAGFLYGSGWENGGGQFGLPTMDTSPSTRLPAGELSEALKITAVHNGRNGDNPVELVTLELFFCCGASGPLSDAEANGLIESLRVYRDDATGPGAGSFQPGEDTQVASISPLSLTDGLQTVEFVDGDMDVQVPWGTEVSYFVVVEPSAGGTIPFFYVMHLTTNSSTGEDAEFDIPLELEYTPVTYALLYINQIPTADAGLDQFFQAAAESTAAVTLDGSGSSDADSDPLTYTWTGPFPEGGGTVTGETANVTLGHGLHPITLTVEDPGGTQDTDTVDITVELPCPETLTVSDQLLSGNQTLSVSGSLTLGPNLTVDGSSVAVSAPTVSILSGTVISGSFSVSNTPACP